MKTQELDLLLTPQTNATNAVTGNPALRSAQLSLSIKVIGQFGIGDSIDACKKIKKLYEWLISVERKNILGRHRLERIKDIHSF